MNCCHNPCMASISLPAPLSPPSHRLPPPTLPDMFSPFFSPSFLSPPPARLQCTPSCGPGYRHRVVLCKSGESGETLPESKCPKQGRPTSRVRCNLQRCPPPQWVTGPWGEVRAASTTPTADLSETVQCVTFGDVCPDVCRGSQSSRSAYSKRVPLGHTRPVLAVCKKAFRFLSPSTFCSRNSDIKWLHLRLQRLLHSRFFACQGAAVLRVGKPNDLYCSAITHLY